MCETTALAAALRAALGKAGGTMSIQLSREQERRTRKLGERVDRVCAADRSFFERFVTAATPRSWEIEAQLRKAAEVRA